MNLWAVLMLFAGGLFAGAATSVSWARVPIWRRMPVGQFTEDFAATIRWADRVQPALLVIAIASTTGFALTTRGSASGLAWGGAIGFTAILAASVVVLVPLQRRIIAARAGDEAAVDEMRFRWFRGHLGRSLLSAASFAGVALAAAVKTS